MAVIDRMDLDNELNMDEQEIAQKFGWEDDYYWGRSNHWQKIKPRMWLLLNKPTSSSFAKVNYPFDESGQRDSRATVGKQIFYFW